MTNLKMNLFVKTRISAVESRVSNNQKKLHIWQLFTPWNQFLYLHIYILISIPKIL